ncbi:hypothetical protein V3H18_05435 [Methylocystis sp. 9N]|uniref:Uncharacterized protein n=1 Tax=Methylocystis borbori TaxID=3118750 RepID=A0ABU7XF23_9HYPH
MSKNAARFTLVAGLMICVACQTGARADADARTAYVISDQDGYGLLECLTQKADCGRIVANSWCEAHGHGAATAFGRAEDLTASTDAKAAELPKKPGAALVACAE